jgi:alpha-beta hydrolase superfamily lysophospholipase
MRILALAVIAVAAVAVVALAAMIAFGTSAPPPRLASISDPFAQVDFRDLPPIQTLSDARGAPLAYRVYRPTSLQPDRVVIAIHGSAGSGTSLHPLARTLRDSGFIVYVPDMRGHGATGRRGDLDYRGQLDDDLAKLTAFVRDRHPQSRPVLLGFSSGGGFVLHIAGSPLGEAYERVVLLSPMLGVGAPTVRLLGDAWAKPFLPRLIALGLLDRLGVHWFDHLPVIAFAIPPERADALTGTYSFRLARDFATRDYVANLRNARAPIAVLVGGNDELFDPEKFAPAIHAVRPDTPVTIVPGLGHIPLTTDARAVPAIVAAIRGAP